MERLTGIGLIAVCIRLKEADETHNSVPRPMLKVEAFHQVRQLHRALSTVPSVSRFARYDGSLGIIRGAE